MSAARFPRASTLLDRLAMEGRAVRLWWRDDDAQRVTPELERLLDLAGTHEVPLALAVIPEGAEAALAERIAAASGVCVLLHGHSHANHAPAGVKRAEFGDHRPQAAMAGEIAAGKTRLEALFGGGFMPVFVPPWNRIGAEARSLLPGLGLTILSVYGPAGPTAPGRPAELNTHLDIMDWRAMRGLSFEEADQRLAALLAARSMPASPGETSRSGFSPIISSMTRPRGA